MQLFVDNITNIDFCYLDPDHGLVGETWLASISLEGDLDEQGMICDFGLVKATARRWLDEHIDHQLLVPSDADELETSNLGESTELLWRYGNHQLHHRSPNQCISLVPTTAITPASAAQWCERKLRELLPQPSIRALKVRFTCEQIVGPYYHYSHGLKKHLGACQRIAHGHRSKIEIFVDGKRDEALEAAWAKRLNYQHIATRADQIAADDNTLTFRYQAQEGEFEMCLPTAHAYLIDTDSTVENIAQHISNDLKREFPARRFSVKAYEGLSKGAIVEV